MSTRPSKFIFHYGAIGLLQDESDIHIELDDDGIITQHIWGRDTIRLKPDDEQWTEFKQRIDKIGIINWKFEYKPPHHIDDGAGYELRLAWDNIRLISKGENNFPGEPEYFEFEDGVRLPNHWPEFDSFVNAVEILLIAPEVERFKSYAFHDLSEKEIINYSKQYDDTDMTTIIGANEDNYPLLIEEANNNNLIPFWNKNEGLILVNSMDPVLCYAAMNYLREKAYPEFKSIKEAEEWIKTNEWPFNL